LGVYVVLIYAKDKRTNLHSEVEGVFLWIIPLERMDE